MEVALIGASGQAGSRILAELTRRGHPVTGIARHPGKIAAGPGVSAKRATSSIGTGLSRFSKGMTPSSVRCISPPAIPIS